MQIKSTIRWYFAFTRMTIVEKLDTQTENDRS